MHDGVGAGNITCDSRISPEDMEEMWNNANVSKEWLKCGEKHGKVQLSHDKDCRPYLSRVELKVKQFKPEIVQFRVITKIS